MSKAEVADMPPDEFNDHLHVISEAADDGF
jgi:hypothetical protein